MRSDCYSCHKIKEDFTQDLCGDCRSREEKIRADILVAQPEATPDQVLYLTRETMKAGGWHSRSGWTDPRAFTRTTGQRPPQNQ